MSNCFSIQFFELWTVEFFPNDVERFRKTPLVLWFFDWLCHSICEKEDNDLKSAQLPFIGQNSKPEFTENWAELLGPKTDNELVDVCRGPTSDLIPELVRIGIFDTVLMKNWNWMRNVSDIESKWDNLVTDSWRYSTEPVRLDVQISKLNRDKSIRNRSKPTEIYQNIKQ